MTTTVKIAPVRKSIHVKASQAHAFEVFTSGLGRWWPRIRASAGCDEVGCHGDQARRPLVRTRRGWRADERRQDHRLGVAQALRHDLGHQQPVESRYGYQLRVRFVSDGANATRVELEHRKFEQMGAEGGEKMRKDVDGGWPGLLEIFKQQAEAE